MLFVPALFSPIILAISNDDVCSLPYDSGVCSSLFMAWYYDPVQEQCREFIYGGCAGNENRFPNETECYKRCRERLIDLHPPTKVTVALGLEDRLLLYWYPPKNYRLHDEYADTQENITAKGPGVTHKEIIVTTTAVPEGSLTAKPQQNNSQNSNTNNTDSDTINQNNTKTSTDITTKTSVDSDSKSNVTDSDSKSNVTESSSKTNITENVNNKNVTVRPNVTESVNNNKNVSDIGESDKPTAKPNEPTSTEKSSDEGTTQGTTLRTDTDNSTADGSKLVVYQLKDFNGKTRVPFHFGNMTGYQVSYKKAEDETAEWVNVQKPLTPDNNEYWLTGLTANTKYRVRVGAMYITNTTVFAEVNGTTQPDPHAKRSCMCNHIGTVGGGKGCNFSLTVLPWCKCKPAYSGLFCELCHSGYYRISDRMPCHKCPCSYVSSTQSCHFIEGYLHCHSCKEGYMGRLCQHCANGYFRDHRHTGSVCAKCQGCHNVGQGLICDPGTGRCTKCHYNTAGHRCDRCLEGFQGDPLKNITCTWIEMKKPGLKMLSPGVIAVICVVTILVISGAVGCIIYRRMRNYPSHRPFWTIELKEGHEGVNFSSVPDDDNDRYHDDVRFFEKESKSKSQPYQKLQEDI